MNERVLVVDDHAGFRRLVRRLLEEAGFEVVGEVADGASVLDAVTRLRPDVVLLDVRLPDLDGFEVAAELAAGPDVILVSSYAADDYGKRIERSGAAGFLTKSELSEESVRSLLGRRR